MCVQICRHMFTSVTVRAAWSKSEQATDSDRPVSVEFVDFVTLCITTRVIRSATFLVRKDLS